MLKTDGFSAFLFRFDQFLTLYYYAEIKIIRFKKFLENLAGVRLFKTREQVNPFIPQVLAALNYRF